MFFEIFKNLFWDTEKNNDLSYINPSIDLFCKSMEWILYDRDFRHEKVKSVQTS